MTVCSDCGKQLQIGDFPFCPHEPIYDRPSTGFQPVVVHRQLQEDGSYKYSYPGDPSDPAPAGYEKVELSTFGQMDRFCRDRESEEQELRRVQIKGEKDYWDQRAKERREGIRRQLQERLGRSESKLLDRIIEAQDRKREKKYQDLMNRPVGFHIQAREYDPSNRREYVRDGEPRRVSIVVNGFRK